MVIPKIRHVIIEKYDPYFSWLLDIISCGLTIKTDKVNFPNSIFLFEGNNCLFHFDNQSKILWCSNLRIWLFFFRSGLKSHKVSDTITPFLREHLKLDIWICSNSLKLDMETFKLFLTDIDLKSANYLLRKDNYTKANHLVLEDLSKF